MTADQLAAKSQPAVCPAKLIAQANAARTIACPDAAQKICRLIETHLTATRRRLHDRPAPSIGIIHFTGIGGIGMSGIAEILHELGYQVQGSDLTANANVKRLRAAGIKVTTPQQAKNLNNVSIVVISTAIKDDNVELIEARSKFLPLFTAQKCWVN